MCNIWASSSDGGNKETMDIILEQMRDSMLDFLRYV